MFTTPIGFLDSTEEVFPENTLHALTYDTTTYEMLGVKVGTADLVTTHAEPLYMKDIDGYYQKFPVDAPVWKGGRVTLSGGAGTDVTAVYADNGTGTLLPQIPRLWRIPAKTNRLIQSNNLADTTLAWVHNFATVAQDIPGLTGEANTGCTVTDNDVANIGLVMGGSVEADLNTASHIFWILKDNDETRFPCVGAIYTYALGALIVSINTKTGEHAIRANNGTGSYEVIDDGLSWKVIIQMPNADGIYHNNCTRVYPAYSATLGGSSVTTTGSCGILQVEIHANKTIDQVRDLGPTFTADVAVATVETVYTIPGANHDDASAAYYFELDSTVSGAFNNPSNTSNSRIIDFSANAFYGLNVTNGAYKSNDGTNFLASTGVIQGINKCGGVYSAPELLQSLYRAGEWSIDKVFDGVMDLTTDIVLGDNVDHAFGIREFRKFPITSLQDGKNSINNLQGIYPVLLNAVISDTVINTVVLTFDTAVTTTDHALGMNISVAGVDRPIALGKKGQSSNQALLYLDKFVDTGEAVIVNYDSTVGDYAFSGAALQSITNIDPESVVANNALTYPYLNNQLEMDDYPADLIGSADISGLGYPRTSQGESGQSNNNDNHSTWLRFGIQAGQPVVFRDLIRIQEAARLAGITQIFQRMVTPYRLFELDNSANMGTWEGHNVACANTHSYTLSPLEAQVNTAKKVLNDTTWTTGVNPLGYRGRPEYSTFFPGHYLYARGGTISNTLNTVGNDTGGSVFMTTASQADRFVNGDWVCIRDGANDFTNAVHRKVLAVPDTVTGELVLGPAQPAGIAWPPGYVNYDHAAGSYISPHMCEGDANTTAKGKVAWLHNTTDLCPLDAGINSGNRRNDLNHGITLNPDRAGMTFLEVTADYMRDHLYMDHGGEVVTDNYDNLLDISGILHDVDREMEQGDTNGRFPDYGNTGSTDRWNMDGTNHWGNGYDLYYKQLRAYFPSFAIVGGSRRAQDSDFLSMNGTQEESMFTGFSNTTPIVDTSWNGSEPWFNAFLVRAHRQRQPSYEVVLGKQGTELFDTFGGISNTFGINIIRSPMAAMCMDRGFYFQQNKTAPNDMTWYDDMGVDVIPGSPTYGNAIAVTSTNGVLMKTSYAGWLGQPLSTFYRYYDATLDITNLLANGDFDTDVTGWTDIGAAVREHVTDDGLDSLGCMKIPEVASNDYNFNLGNYGVKASSSIATISGQMQTLCFSAKTNLPQRTIYFGDNGLTGSQIIDNVWRRYVVSFRSSGSTCTPFFDTSRYNGDLFLDNVRFIDGFAGVYRRDFEKGIVLWNPSNSARTVSLETTYLKIQGTAVQVAIDNHNDGTIITNNEITIPAWDAYFLVREDS